MNNQLDSDDEPTRMREVSHTNPYTNESMGSVFEHGVTIVADGGKRDAAPEATDDADVEAAAEDGRDVDPDAGEDPGAATSKPDDDEDATPMRDVSHEAPEGGHGNRMFERVGDTADVVDEE